MQPHLMIDVFIVIRHTLVYLLLTIVAGNGVQGWFLDPGSIDPDRGSGTTTGRYGRRPGPDPIRCVLTT
jgi:hypothetical protein